MNASDGGFWGKIRSGSSTGKISQIELTVAKRKDMFLRVPLNKIS